MDCRAGTDYRSACLCTLRGTCIGSHPHHLSTRRHSCRVTGSHCIHWHPVCRSFQRRRACRYRQSGTRWQSSGHHWHKDLRHRDQLAGKVFLRMQRNYGLGHAFYKINDQAIVLLVWELQPFYKVLMVMMYVTWPPRWAAALVCLETLKLTSASIKTRRADAGIDNGCQTAAVSKA